MVIFGHPIRDPIPTPLGKFCPHPTWQETMVDRSKALAKRHNREREKWDEHTKNLKPLNLGDHVYIQNMIGYNPLRWDRTGVIVEAKPFKQYSVKVDGTGRVTLRNRKHLRKFIPYYNKDYNIPMITTQPVRLESPQVDKQEAVGTCPQQLTPVPKPENSITVRSESQLPQQTPEPEIAPLKGEDGSEEENNNGFEVPGPQLHDEPATVVPIPTDNLEPKCISKKLPLALRRLFPHNKPGLTE